MKQNEKEKAIHTIKCVLNNLKTGTKADFNGLEEIHINERNNQRHDNSASLIYKHEAQKLTQTYYLCEQYIVQLVYSFETREIRAYIPYKYKAKLYDYSTYREEIYHSIINSTTVLSELEGLDLLLFVENLCYS